MLNEKQSGGDHRGIGPLDARKPAPPVPAAMSAPLPGTKTTDGRSVTVRDGRPS